MTIKKKRSNNRPLKISQNWTSNGPVKKQLMILKTEGQQQTFQKVVKYVLYKQHEIRNYYKTLFLTKTEKQNGKNHRRNIR
jgi:hypothetical protein